jgi:hypothetical protein
MSDEPKLIQRRPRVVGLFFLVTGCLLAKLSIYDVVARARQTTEPISVSHQGIAMSVFALVVGGALVGFSARAAELVRDRNGQPWPPSRKVFIAALSFVCVRVL